MLPARAFLRRRPFQPTHSGKNAGQRPPRRQPNASFCRNAKPGRLPGLSQDSEIGTPWLAVSSECFRDGYRWPDKPRPDHVIRASPVRSKAGDLPNQYRQL